MKKWAVVFLVMLALLSGLGLPSPALAGAFVGGLALGAAITAPYAYP